MEVSPSLPTFPTDSITLSHHHSSIPYIAPLTVHNLESCLLYESKSSFAYLFVALTSALSPSSFCLRPIARRGTMPKKATSQRYSRLLPKIGFISGNSCTLEKPSVPMLKVWMKPKSDEYLNKITWLANYCLLLLTLDVSHRYGWQR